MKKQIIVVIGICMILSSISVTTGAPIQHLRRMQERVPHAVATMENGTPPAWATGNFSGVWGLNIAGQPLSPVGWLAGYYSNMGLGRFVGVFALFNTTNATGYIGGILLGPFMLGIVGNSTTGNQTYFIGLGGANTTHFYWRIMGFVGPTFYMYGVYSKFENMTRVY